MKSDAEVARVVHAMHAAMQVNAGEEAPVQPWDVESPEEQGVVINGVAKARELMKDWGYWNDMAAGTAARDLHAEWCRYQLEHGWAYAAVKDWNKKTHPFLCEWSMLPDEIQRKNMLFLAAVWQLAVRKGVLLWTGRASATSSRPSGAISPGWRHRSASTSPQAIRT